MLGTEHMDAAGGRQPGMQGLRSTSSLGALLRQQRLAAGLTQDALAEKAQLSARAIADLERGVRRYPYPDTLERLASALGLTAHERELLAALAHRPRPPTAPSQVGTLSPSGLLLLRPGARGSAPGAMDTAGVPNFPRHLTSFVGRQAELAELLATMTGARVVTLLGPAGVGKTRLAIELATQLNHIPQPSRYFVDLAPLGTPELLEHAFIVGLGGRGDAGARGINTIVRLLGQGVSLMVLDNCEQLVDPVARLVTVLLHQVPNVHILATSREPLDIACEVRWAVPPLSEQDGVHLFTQRACLIDPHFARSVQSTERIAQVCRTLDGLPLAIELAAARVGQLGMQDIVARLDAPFDLLRRRARDTELRHHTLHAAINWSFDLLHADERAAFRRLAVFSGGFDPDAGEHVAGCPFDVLGRLVDKSMLVAGVGVGGRARYRLLETLRYFAALRLAESDGADEARARHFHWYASMARQAAAELRGPRQGGWMDRLQVELGNLRAALAWGADHAAAAALAMALDLTRFWASNQTTEGRAWLERLLARVPDAPNHARARALTALGNLASDIGEPEVGRLQLQQALAIWRRIDDPGGIAETLLFLAQTSTGTAVLGDRRAVLEEAAAQARRSGDSRLLAETLTMVGIATHSAGAVDDGRALLEEAVATARRADDPRSLALALQLLGHVDESERHFDDALIRHLEGLELAIVGRLPWQQAHAHIHIGLCRLAQENDADARLHFEAALRTRAVGYYHCGAIVGMAQVAARDGKFARALRLHGAASLATWPTVLYRTDLAQLEQQPWFEAARRTLGADGVLGVWRTGAAMTPEEAINCALNDQSPGAVPT